MAQCRWTRAIPSQIHFCAACPAEQLKHEERKRGRRQVLKVEGPQGSDVGKRQRAERRTELCRSVCTEVVAAWTVGRVIISSSRTLGDGTHNDSDRQGLFPARVHHKTPLDRIERSTCVAGKALPQPLGRLVAQRREKENALLFFFLPATPQKQRV